MGAILAPRGRNARGALDSNILPSACLSPCNDYTFGQKTAVGQDSGRRDKNGHFSSGINTVTGSTGKTSEIAPSAPNDAGDNLDIPPFLQVANRKVPLDRKPALGPEGDSLDDLK